MSNILSLGEILLRISPPLGKRLSDFNNADFCYGGAEANVAVSLSNFGHNVSFVSKLPDNSFGIGAKQYLSKYNINTKNIVLGGERLGIYFLEIGTGNRNSSVIYDRAYSSFATMRKLEWDLDELFEGIDLFYVTGITLSLSDFWNVNVVKLMQEAKKRNIKVSFDINYRGKLWSREKAKNILSNVFEYIDYCSLGLLDASYLMDIDFCSEKFEDLEEAYKIINKKYPNISALYCTKRTVNSANNNDLQGFLWKDNKMYVSTINYISSIVDRVGGGDAFSAGVLHGLLNNLNLDYTINFATLASALKHTVYGDANQFYVSEIDTLIKTGNKEILR